MRSIEIQPRNGSHYILVDGKQWSRHNELKIAEQVRNQLIRDVWVAKDQIVDAWHQEYQRAAQAQENRVQRGEEAER
jgi:hypothetical protein